MKLDILTGTIPGKIRIIGNQDTEINNIFIITKVLLYSATLESLALKIKCSSSEMRQVTSFTSHCPVLVKWLYPKT